MVEEVIQLVNTVQNGIGCSVPDALQVISHFGLYPEKRTGPRDGTLVSVTPKDVDAISRDPSKADSILGKAYEEMVRAQGMTRWMNTK